MSFSLKKVRVVHIIIISFCDFDSKFGKLFWQKSEITTLYDSDIFSGYSSAFTQEKIAEIFLLTTRSHHGEIVSMLSLCIDGWFLNTVFIIIKLDRETFQTSHKQDTCFTCQIHSKAEKLWKRTANFDFYWLGLKAKKQLRNVAYILAYGWWKSTCRKWQFLTQFYACKILEWQHKILPLSWIAALGSSIWNGIWPLIFSTFACTKQGKATFSCQKDSCKINAFQERWNVGVPL